MLSETKSRIHFRKEILNAAFSTVLQT